MRIGELIEKYLEKNKLSQREFAKKCGLSNGYISMLINNENPNTGKPIEPSIKSLLSLSAGLGMDMDELMNVADDTCVNISPNIMKLPKTRKIPILGTIACGEPIWAEQNFEGEVRVPDNIDADYALRCKGDSMIDFRILDGDIVYIKQQSAVNNGEIAAVLIDNEATLKRFYFDGKTVKLVAGNSKYRPFHYTGENLENFRVLGRAVGFTSIL